MAATEETSSLASPLVASEDQQPSAAVTAAERPVEVPPELTTPEPDAEDKLSNSETPFASLGGSSIAQLLQPHAGKYQEWRSALRPWADFLQLAWPRTLSEASSRVPSNLREYWANYTLLLVVCAGAAIIMCPVPMIVTVLLALSWVAVLKRMDDPSSKVKIGSMELGRPKQMLLFGILTLLAVSLFVVPIILAAVPGCVPAILLHTLLHPGAAENDGLRAACLDPEAGTPAREVPIRCEAEAATDSAE